MSAAYGLPLIGVLLIVFALVRNVARKDRVDRQRRKRQVGRFYWEPADRSERSQMRQDAHHDTVIGAIDRTGPRPPKSR